MRVMLAIKARCFARTFFVVSVARLVSNLIRVFGLKCIANRYSGEIYFFRIREDRKLYTLEESESRDLLNIGSGGFRHPRWTNIDVPSVSGAYKKIQGKPNVDFLPLDLIKARKLPYDSDSVHAVYTSHCIEHLPRAIVIRLLTEINRVLCFGGTLRVTCPDAELYAARAISLWSRNRIQPDLSKTIGAIHHSLSGLAGSNLEKLFCKPLNSRALLFRIEEMIKGESVVTNDPSHHLSWWTRESLLACLIEAGFNDPVLSSVGQSRFLPMTNLALFDCTLPEISLFVEARK